MAGERAIVSGMTGRYASALFELARESNSVDLVAVDLDRFEALLAAAPDLARLVRSPVFSAQEQLQALTAVLDRIGLSDLTARFLKVVTANRRLFAVPGMIKAYRALLASHRGEIAAEVTFAEPPSAGQLSAVTEALTALTSKQVKVDVRTDPAIIGGLIVRLGSRMVDSSLRSRLNAIKHAMKGVS